MLRTNHWHLLPPPVFPPFSPLRQEDRPAAASVGNGFPRSVFVLAARWFAVEFARVVDTARGHSRTIRPALRTALTRFAFFDLALALTSAGRLNRWAQR